MTTSQRLERVKAAVGGGEYAAPRRGLSSTRTGSTPSARSLRSDAWPSWPRPPDADPRPAQVRPAQGRPAAPAASCVPEGVRRGDEAGADRVPHGLDLRLGGRVRAAGDLGREFLQQRRARRGRAAGRRARTAARHSLTSPTHSNGLVPEPSRVWNFGLSSGLSSGSPPPPSAREDRAQLLRRHERGQDQVDEAALVALPAPVAEPARGVDVEGPVTAAERAGGTGSAAANRSPTHSSVRSRSAEK